MTSVPKIRYATATAIFDSYLRQRYAQLAPEHKAAAVEMLVAKERVGQAA